MSTTPPATVHPRPARAARATTAVRTGRAHGHLRRGVGVIHSPEPTPIVTTASGDGRSDATRSVHDYARRMAFLTELDSATWMSRYNAADRLGDPDAVSSIAGYGSWLRRTAAAWSAVPLPTSAQSAAIWPFASMAVTCLDAAAHLDADLRDLARSTGGPHAGHPAQARAARTTEFTGDLDAAYVAGAAYVAVAVSQEVAVLAADADHLSLTASRTPLPRSFVHHSLQVATARNLLRRELADWADAAGSRAAERVVQTAGMLLDTLAGALVTSGRPGW